MAKRERWILEEKLTHSIIGGCYAVHTALGYGFLEHVYVRALEKELIRRGHRVAREVWVPVYYLGEIIAYQRMDMIVDDKVAVEAKAEERMPRRGPKQLFNYLRCTPLEIGILFNFGYEADFRRLVHTRDRKNFSVSSPSA